MKSVHFGSEIKTIKSTIFKGCVNLTCITVSEDNTRYASANGCLYNKSKTLLYMVPNGLQEIVIPSGAEEINSRVIFGNSNVEKVVIPESLTKLGNQNLTDCPNLREIIIDPANESYVMYKGVLYDYAKTNLIAGTANLTELYASDFADSLEKIETYAFYNNPSLSSVEIPDSVKNIGLYAFGYCKKLENITLPKGEVTYDSSVFSNCINLKNLTIPDGVTDLGISMFYDCSSLETIVFPKSLTSISSYAFYGCYNLKSITMSEKITTIDEYAFYGCDKLEITDLPSDLQSIGEKAFYHCRNIKTLTIPDSVLSIGNNTFGFCSNLNDLKLGKGLSSLPANAFYKCESLLKVVIPQNIRSYDATPFSDCRNLESIVFLGDNSFSGNIISGNEKETTIYYPGENSSWSNVKANDFGENIKLYPYFGGNYESGIHDSHVIINGGWKDAACYALSEGTFSYTNSYDIFRQYAVQEVGGIYFLSNDRLMFLAESDGTLETVKYYGEISNCYERDGILCISSGNCIFRYDLKHKMELSSILLPDIDSIQAIGMDQQDRYYVGHQEGEECYLSLYNSEGELLSQIKVEHKIYSFAGINSQSDTFYMESDIAFESHGLNYWGNVLTIGKVKDNKLSLIDTSYYSSDTFIEKEIAGLEFLSQQYKYYHQSSAQLLNDKYLVTTSNVHSRVRVINTDDLSDVINVDREINKKAILNNSYDTTGVGSKTLLLQKHNSVLIADNDKTLHEYDLKTGEECYSYKTAHPVFSLMAMGDYTIVIEKQDDTFYIEKMKFTDPDKVTISGNQTMKVGETQHLQINMAYRSILSSNPSVADVNKEGYVTAWAKGKTTITVETLDGRTATYDIEVMDNSAPVVTETSHLAYGMISNNISANDYSSAAKTVKSYLVEKADGTFERIEFIENTGVIIETYSSDWTYKSRKVLQAELPVFGGFFNGSDAYYIVYGQDNDSNDDNLEVIRLVKYSKSWSRIGELSLKDIEVKLPFHSGNLQMTETKGRLYVHTCNEFYNGHQGNISFVVDESSMKLVEQHLGIYHFVFVSHSFNQFIRTDGTYVYRVDQGDGNPRAINISRCDVDEEQPITSDGHIGGMKSVINHHAYEMKGPYGRNFTGVSIGGLELSENNCLIAGNSVDMSLYADDEIGDSQRNIFVTITDKDLTKTRVVWFTDYNNDSHVLVRNPHLVKLSEEQFILMWEEYDQKAKIENCNFVTIDGNGKTIAKHSSRKIRLSDCHPLLTSNGRLVWYVTNRTNMKFYEINPFRLSEGSTVNLGQCDITLSLETQKGDNIETVYSGNPIMPTVQIKYQDIILLQGVDYDLTYQDNCNAGTAKVIIDGKGEYVGSITKTFKILKKSQSIVIAPSSINVNKGDCGSFTVTGKGTITASVNDGSILSLDSKNTVADKTTFNYTGLRTGSTVITVSVSGDQNYNSVTSTVVAKVVSPDSSKNLQDMQIIFTKIGDISYADRNNSWGLLDGNTLLVKGEDYIVEDYLDAVDPSQLISFLKIKLRGCGDYSGSIEKYIYPILQHPVLHSAITDQKGTLLKWREETGAAGYYIYRTKGSSTEKIATIEKSTVTSWLDKSVTNANAGYSYYIVTYTYNLSGMVKSQASNSLKTQALIKKENTITASNQTVYYSNSAKTIYLKARCYGSAALKYTSDNSNISVNSAGTVVIGAKYIGSGTITIEASETSEYKVARKTITITVLPGKTTISSVSSKKAKTILVKWKKNIAGNGYEIYYATNKSFTKGLKKVTIKKQKIVSKTISKLARKKTYFVKVRTYKKVGAKTYYGPWSLVKSCKVK
ncbi:MAG: leucine-rich repeat protein [Lachnospiraceae bacterium]|nr:leucine-rich repeat protein [Lachnospiraceae bacterium]